MEFKVSSAKDKIVVDRYKMAIAIVETEVEQQNLPLLVVIAVVLEIANIKIKINIRKINIPKYSGVPNFIITKHTHQSHDSQGRISDGLSFRLGLFAGDVVFHWN